MNEINMEPARLMDETFEEYIIRRAEINKRTKALKHGKEFWDSNYAGTYKNSTKRALQAERKARRQNKRSV